MWSVVYALIVPTNWLGLHPVQFAMIQNRRFLCVLLHFFFMDVCVYSDS